MLPFLQNLLKAFCPPSLEDLNQARQEAAATRQKAALTPDGKAR